MFTWLQLISSWCDVTTTNWGWNVVSLTTIQTKDPQRNRFLWSEEEKLIKALGNIHIHLFPSSVTDSVNHRDQVVSSLTVGFWDSTELKVTVKQQDSKCNTSCNAPWDKTVKAKVIPEYLTDMLKIKPLLCLLSQHRDWSWTSLVWFTPKDQVYSSKDWRTELQVQNQFNQNSSVSVEKVVTVSIISQTETTGRLSDMEAETHRVQDWDCQRVMVQESREAVSSVPKNPLSWTRPCRGSLQVSGW